MRQPDEPLPFDSDIPVSGSAALRSPLGNWFSRKIAIAFLALVSVISSTASGVSLTPEEQELAERFVGDRGQQRSSGQMTLDPILTAVARARAADMAKRRYFSHVNPDGYGPNHLLRSAGYPMPSSWTDGRSDNFVESIGAGYATPAAAWEGWMHSSGHRTHLLASSSFYRNQTNFGIGFCYDPRSPYRSYWVVITAPPPDRFVAATGVRAGSRPLRVALKFPVVSWMRSGRRSEPERRETSTRVAPRPIFAKLAKAAGKPGDRDTSRNENSTRDVRWRS